MKFSATMLALLSATSLSTVVHAERVATDLSSELRSAERVVVGQVVSTQSFRQRNKWGDELIITRATVRADETLKGVASGSVAVDIEGGTLNGVTLRVSDFPTLNKGERAVFLLKRGNAGAYLPHNRGAGVLKLTPNDTVQNTTLSLGQVRRLAAEAR